jgi:WD40 repeat protein/DNA-binding SARP family transcriptional activator
MGVNVLGPLSVDGDGEVLAPRDRVVLAALVTRLGEPVSADALADALWGDAPPATWPKVVQSSMVRIRKVLGTDAVKTTGRGYALMLPVEDVDAVRFERGVRRGRELLDLGDPERARFTLTDALGLWHGEALADLDGWEPGTAASQRLHELRRDAEELRVDAALQAGGWREVLAEATALVAEQPLREQRWGLLARAQYQAGRQGEALATLQRARAVLVNELGLDPGADLVALEQAILRQDPQLLPEHEGAAAATGVCPYRGLLPYDVDSAEDYFGRDRAVAVCRQVMTATNVLAVVGPSGSGKSSLVRAGVAAGLRRDGHEVAVLTPGAHPMRALAEAEVLRTSTVLLVDQLEEAATVCDDRVERDAFLDALVAHADSGAGVVLALRADRLGLLSGHRGLARLIERGLHLLGPMSETDLRAAIEGPAHRAGLLLEPGLVDLLVTEVAGEPGPLPLLSHALAQTWANREGRTLTVDGYRAAGGIRGAVAQSAETLFQHLPPGQQQMVRDLMLRLVTTGPDGQAARSPVPHRVVEGDTARESLLETLVEARLVTTDGETIELAHEALVGAWPRLRTWLDEDVEGQPILRHLTVAADTWQAMSRPVSELYRGTRLARALDWRDHTSSELTSTEQAFLDAGRDLAEAESRSAEQRLAEQRRANRRLRGSLLGVAALLVVALVAGGLAVREGQRADATALSAQVREIAAASRAATSTDPELALLLALEAADLSRTASLDPAREAVEALHGAVIAHRIDQVVPGLGGSAAWSPTGDLWVTEGPEDEGVIDLRDPETGESVRSWVAHEIDVNDVAFSPSGLLATTGDDGALRVWDPQDGRMVAEVVGEGEVWGPSFSADSGRLSASWLGQQEQLVRVVDVTSGQVVVEVDIPGFPRETSISPDGTRVAVGTFVPAAARVVDASTGEVVHALPGHEGGVAAVAYSPDGAWIATASEDSTVRIRDGQTGTTVHTVTDFGSTVFGLAWAPDSRRLAAGGLDGRIRVVDVSESQARTAVVLAGVSISRGVYGLAFSPDGQQLVSGDYPVTAATLWDVGPDGDAEVANLPSNTTTFGDGAYLPDGTLATTTGDRSVTVWDPTEGAELKRLESDDTWADDLRSIAVSPDGTLLAAGDTGDDAAVWALSNGGAVFSKSLGPGVGWPAFSPDSALLALAGGNGTLNLYERDGSLAAQLLAEEANGLQDPAFSPDGTTVAVAQLRNDRQVPDHRLLLWDWRSDTTRSWDVGTGTGPVFSPDGTRLAMRNISGPAEVWDVDSGRPLFALEGHTSGVVEVAYSPDGTLIATAGFDGTARLWDAETGDAVLCLPQLAGEVSSVAFSPDGRHLATHSLAEGMVRVWTLDPDELVAIATKSLTRQLTPAECTEYLHTDTCA